ncbi:hypothetical protein VTK56DRAFT_7119 [Thermocarpiscus australiensis]
MVPAPVRVRQAPRQRNMTENRPRGLSEPSNLAVSQDAPALTQAGRERGGQESYTRAERLPQPRGQRGPPSDCGSSASSDSMTSLETASALLDTQLKQPDDTKSGLKYKGASQKTDNGGQIQPGTDRREARLQQPRHSKSLHPPLPFQGTTHPLGRVYSFEKGDDRILPVASPISASEDHTQTRPHGVRSQWISRLRTGEEVVGPGEEGSPDTTFMPQQRAAELASGSYPVLLTTDTSTTPDLERGSVTHSTSSGSVTSVIWVGGGTADAAGHEQELGRPAASETAGIEGCPGPSQPPGPHPSA